MNEKKTKMLFVNNITKTEIKKLYRTNDISTKQLIVENIKIKAISQKKKRNYYNT